MVKNETWVERCAGWIESANTQECLNVYLTGYVPYIKDEAARTECRAMIERARPTLPTQAWLDATDIEDRLQRRDVRRARQAEWQAIRCQRKAAAN
jgi:hypothetical protein